MATNVVTEREIITEIFKLYKNSPCLWDVTHRLYYTKEEREKQYEPMLAVYRRLDPEITMKNFKKKMGHFRTAYRRERKKVESGMVSGRKREPMLWYYKHLTFLNGIEKPDNGKDSCDEDYGKHSPVRAKRRRASEAIEMSSNNEEDSVNTENCEAKCVDAEGYIHSYGETIARQLMELDTPVRYEVERIIADVIYSARTGNLQKYTSEAVDTLVIPSSGPSWYDVQDDSPATQGDSFIKVEHELHDQFKIEES